jgi:hypothetical protein
MRIKADIRRRLFLGASTAKNALLHRFAPISNMIALVSLDFGGAGSMSAIGKGVDADGHAFSRDLGIPCAVSVTDATKIIPDGALIELDGDTGAVTILDVALAATAA